jgi:hypothetical protein
VQFAKTVGEMKRDAACRARWIEIYPVLTRDEDGLVGSLTSRAEAHVTRLSMLYALVDLSPVIRLEHLEAALALWNYAVDSARHIFGDQLGDPMADALLAALRSRPEGVSRTTITKEIFGGHRKKDEIASALARLKDLGLVAVEMQETAGRTAEVWKPTAQVATAQNHGK